MTYENMKDSGVQWIGPIPSHWKITRSKIVFQNISVKNHPDALVLSLYRDLGVLPKESRDDNHNVTSEDTSQYKYVEKGNLVINKMKAWQGSLAVSDYSGIVSPAYYVCRFRDNSTNKKYIHYLLRCGAYAQEFECLSTGMRVGQWDLGIDDFLAVPIIMPSSPEQERISKFLDKRCSEIDSIIAEAQSSIDDYKRWKASVIYQAVTKGLNPDVEMKDSGVPWIGDTPCNWKRQKIANLFYEIGSGTTPASNDSSYYDGTIPWLQSGDLKNGKIAETSKCITQSAIDDFSALRIYKAPFIAIAMYGASIANTGVVYVDACTNQACCVVSKAKRNVDFKYAYYAICASKEEMLLSARGGTQPNISQEIIRQLKIPVPSVEEQIKISQYLDGRVYEIESLIKEKESLIADLESYKKSLIYEAVTGKRKVI